MIENKSKFEAVLFACIVSVSTMLEVNAFEDDNESDLVVKTNENVSVVEMAWDEQNGKVKSIERDEKWNTKWWTSFESLFNRKLNNPNSPKNWNEDFLFFWGWEWKMACFWLWSTNVITVVGLLVSQGLFLFCFVFCWCCKLNSMLRKGVSNLSSAFLPSSSLFSVLSQFCFLFFVVLLLCTRFLEVYFPWFLFLLSCVIVLFELLEVVEWSVSMKN